jgi:hypothetical protein
MRTYTPRMDPLHLELLVPVLVVIEVVLAHLHKSVGCDLRIHFEELWSDHQSHSSVAIKRQYST